MKQRDFIVFGVVLLILAPFFIFDSVYDCYSSINSNHPYFTAFLKFAILATFGEALGLRIKTGNYNENGFGLIARSVVWGLLGIWIAIAMKIFAIGVPILLNGSKLDGIIMAMGSSSFSIEKLIGAFGISLMMNTCFAPIFMTLHKITDSHIIKNNGSLKSLITPINMGNSLSEINWKIQWGFVFKKTIPFFWIPAHTITFMLPYEYQVLFAAVLGIALGVILSIAAVLSRK